jgi:hypothetical protein
VVQSPRTRSASRRCGWRIASAALTLRPGRVLTDSDAAQLADELRAAGRPLGGVVVAIPAA